MPKGTARKKKAVLDENRFIETAIKERVEQLIERDSEKDLCPLEM